MIGDVAGKGVPAALFMAKVVSDFKIFAKRGMPSEVVGEINAELVRESGSNLFVTLTYMVFDTDDNKASFAIGGHNPTVFVKPNGEVKMLDAKEGMPLGLVEGNFSEEEVDYEKGSVFILYTDGVTEAMDLKEEMFGEERLKKLAGSLKDRPAKEIVDAILEAVNKHAAGAPQYDDITVMVIKT